MNSWGENWNHFARQSGLSILLPLASQYNEVLNQHGTCPSITAWNFFSATFVDETPTYQRKAWALVSCTPTSSYFLFLLPSARNCGKVMFLHLSVILFTGGGLSPEGGLCRGGLCPGRGAGLCPGRGAGLCPGRGEVSVQEGASLSRGVSVRETPPVR